MDLDLTVLRLASGLASHATARQTVIAENIANADTPGYRARDVAGFAESFERTVPAFEARATRSGHLTFGDLSRGFEVRESAFPGAETPNGNSVSLEDQMVRAADVRQRHDLAIGVYQKSLDILRTSLGRR